MFALLVIVFLVAFPFAIDAATSGSLAALATPAVLIAGFLVYFAPTIAAGQRGHLSANAIFIVNLFFGWTLLGWLIALIWRSRPSIAESSLSRAASRFGWKIIEPRLADYGLRRSLYDRRPQSRRVRIALASTSRGPPSEALRDDCRRFSPGLNVLIGGLQWPHLSDDRHRKEKERREGENGSAPSLGVQSRNVMVHHRS
jgi:hypothetical protein